MAGSESGARTRSVAGSLSKKLLMPLVATAASAAASYAAKKAPQLLEEKVLPKLKQTWQGSEHAVDGMPARAKAAVSGAGDLAEGLTERMRAVTGDGTARSPRRDSLSAKQLEQRRNQREQRRAARRKASAR